MNEEYEDLFPNTKVCDLMVFDLIDYIFSDKTGDQLYLTLEE